MLFFIWKSTEIKWVVLDKMRLVKTVQITGPNQFLLRRNDEGSDILIDLEMDEIFVTDSVFHYTPMDGEMDANLDEFFKNVDGKRLSEWTEEQRETLKIYLSWDWYDPNGSNSKGFLPSAEFMMGKKYFADQKPALGGRRLGDEPAEEESTALVPQGAGASEIDTKELTIMRYDEEEQYRYPETEEGLLDLPVGTLVYVHSLQEVTQILEVGTIDDKVFYKISVPLRETWTRWFAQLSQVGGAHKHVLVPASSLHPSNRFGVVILNSLPWDWWGIAQTALETITVGLVGYGMETYLGVSGIRFVTIAGRMTSGALNTRWVTVGNRISNVFRKLPRSAALAGGFKRHGLVQISQNYGIVSQTYSMKWLTSAYTMWQIYRTVQPRALAISISSTLEGDPVDIPEEIAKVTTSVQAVYKNTKKKITSAVYTSVYALVATIGILVGVRVYRALK